MEGKKIWKIGGGGGGGGGHGKDRSGDPQDNLQSHLAEEAIVMDVVTRIKQWQ